jgi:hypothetical protein
MPGARFALHVAVMTLFVSLPLAPLPWIRGGLYLVPALITAQWVLISGCVIGNPDADAESDTTRLYRMVAPTMTTQASNDLTCLIAVLITTAMAYRMSRPC